MNARGKYYPRPLKHCRVCGMDAGIRKVTVSVPEQHLVVCEVCGFKTKRHKSQAHATREWNGGRHE